MGKIIAAILGGLFVILVAQNTEVVTYRFLFWDVTMSRILILLITLTVGMTIGYVLGRSKRKQAAVRVAP